MYLRKLNLLKTEVSICVFADFTAQPDITFGVQFGDGKLRLGVINFTTGQRIMRQLRWHLPRLARRANPLPVYWASDSRDCDHVRASSAHRSTTGWHYVQDVDRLYDHAEGPTGHWLLSKADYRTFQGSWRDYNAEAFEDGHPHSPRY